MEKLIVKDKTFLAEHVTFSSTRPIKLLYNGMSNPIFTIKANEYNLSTNKPHTTMSFKQLDGSVKDFLLGLDDMIPRIAYERRKDWFTSDLFDSDLDSFVENYRKNISEYGFSIYLGLSDKDELPVVSFIKDVTPDNLRCLGTSKPLTTVLPVGLGLSQENKTTQTRETRKLLNSFQELAWGNKNGQVTILAQVTGLWIKEESYGLSWKILQILYRRCPSLPLGSLAFTTSEKILEHTWHIPPDEADPVELPDEDDPSLPDLTSSESSSIIPTKIPKSTGSDGSSSLSQNISSEKTEVLSASDTGIDASALPSKPYNPLMETDD